MAEISVRVSNSGPLTSDRHLNRAAVEAEQMGFDSISLHDHVVWNTDMGRRRISSGAHEALCDGQSADFFESLTTIGYLAAKTSTAQPATLDHLSGGRLIAGVGLGSRASKEPSEFDEAMRAIWTQPLASHTGDHISFKDGDLSKATPATGTGALGRRVDGRRPAYRQGRGRVPVRLPPAEMACGAEIVWQTAEQHDSKPDGTTVAVEKLTVSDNDRAAAMARALPTVEPSSVAYERDVDQIQFALDDGRTHTPAIGN